MSGCSRRAPKKPGMQEPSVIIYAQRDCSILPMVVYVCDYECLCVHVHVYTFIMFCQHRIPRKYYCDCILYTDLPF